MEHNIAILILAHHNPEQLSYLIDLLQPDFDVYVQIDKKSSLNISELPAYPNVFYYKDISVFWGDYSQVLNMQYILEKAFSNKVYGHYCYISGDDLPIKSNAYIKSFFKKNNDSIYMYANPLPIKTWGFNHGFDRLDRYWFMKFTNRTLVKGLGRLTLGLQKILHIKRKRFPIDFYAGSNWVNLSQESVTYLFKFLEEQPRFLQKLQYSRATDEIWIQTILMNSPLRTKIQNKDMRYIDWTKGPQYPRILDSTDKENLIQSESLFARKFHFNPDSKNLIRELIS